MRTVKIISLLTASLFFMGYYITANSQESSSTGIKFTGESHANNLLKRDTLKTIKIYFSTKGCDSIEHVDSKVFLYEPMNREKNHVWGKEGWMVTGCAKPLPFLVIFTEDGNGGTFFSIKMK